MATTINGKSREEILDALRAPEEKKGEINGYSFYETKQFQKRLDAVLGFNCWIEYRDGQYVLNKANQDMLTCFCRITIVDDDGAVVKIAEGWGGREIQYVKDTGRCSTLQNTTEYAQLDALSSAAKQLGVFATYTEETKTNKGVKRGNASNNTSPTLTGLFITHSVMKLNQSGANGTSYVLPVRLITEKGEDKEASMLFYENQYSKEKEQFNKVLQTLPNYDLVTGVKMKLKYTVGSRGGYVFKGFVEGR